MARRELQWSLSRAATFERCRRAYYYRYYHYREAHLPDPPETARLAAQMRQMKGLEEWGGCVVHETIQELLRRLARGLPVGPEEARTEVVRRLSHGWRDSLRRVLSRHPPRPDGEPTLLLDHYYRTGPVDEERTAALKDRAVTSVLYFLDSEVFQLLRHIPDSQWLPIEKYASFRAGDVLVLVKPDFACRYRGKLLIVDWKTGRPEERESFQLALYALFAAQQWHGRLEDVVATLLRLYPTASTESWEASRSPLEVTLGYVAHSHEQMMCQTAHPLADVAPEEDFPQTSDLKRCSYCRFQGLCGDRGSGFGGTER